LEAIGDLFGHDSDTLVFDGLRPLAVALTVMSRSVNVPLSSSPSQTGISPTSRSFILAAASFSGALERMTSTSLVITSPRRIINLLESALLEPLRGDLLYDECYAAL